MSKSILHIKDLDIDNVEIVKVKEDRRSFFTLCLNELPLEFSTSILYTPFGINKNINNYTHNNEYSINISVNSSDQENATKSREMLEKLDEKIKNLINDNLDFFKVESKWEYMSCYKNNKDYPKLMKLNFNRDKNGNFITHVFDSNKEKILLNEENLEELFKKGSSFKAIINCAKVWSYNNRIGTIWNIKQLLISPPQTETVPGQGQMIESTTESGGNSVSAEPTGCIMLE
jgi:small-conductance mechanosensitive channel